MRVGPAEIQHLTYCLNVHAGESWAENLESIERYACAVRQQMGVDEPFGLGLRLSAAAAQTLAQPRELEQFRRFLDERGLYVFTINGFPYGSFHGKPVKEQVYAPDWRQPERVDYTCQLASILSALLPEGLSGSISTVPGSYKVWIQTEADRRQVAQNLLKVAGFLSRLADDSGCDIHVGLEPEPDCLLETTEEIVKFFAEDLSRAVQVGAGVTEASMRRHLGVCVDTCHLALQFEDPGASLRHLVASGVRISKIQLSAALRAVGDRDVAQDLGAFADSVYLHQTRVRVAGGDVRRFADLPEAIESPGGLGEIPGEWRVHCHVPLYWQGTGRVSSTAVTMDDAFFAAVRNCGCTHLELETYTFDVLPPELRTRGVVASVADEYGWALEKIKPWQTVEAREG